MHRLISRHRQRAALYGWIKWIPVLGIPFSLMFFDAWLNIATRNNDYDFARLSNQVRTLTGELEKARAQKAENENLEDLAAKAPNLGLVEPGPNQIITMRWDGKWRERPGEIPFALARAQGTIDTMAAIPATGPVPLVIPAPDPAASGAANIPLASPPVSPSPEAVTETPSIASIESMEEAKLLGSIAME
ncbi:MAG TPA: hypothetical protein PLI09_06355 [Candidatus Hydrogenedentes bacterium]|nr:hypothetical protein [Candidatus Hydrogenedentota bacterium]